MGKNEIIKKLKVNIKKYSSILNDTSKHNKKLKLLKHVAKVGYISTYVLPYVITFPMLFYIKKENDRNPFVKKTYIEKELIEVIDTSNGIHIEHSSDDYVYDNKSIEYSTGWKLTNNGFYERKVTSYDIDNDIDIDNVDEVFKLSKEEIDDILTINNVKTIDKRNLGPEDYYYKEDGFIITNYVESGNIVEKKEKTSDFIMGIIIFNFIGVLSGTSLLGADKLFDGAFSTARKKIRSCDFEPVEYNEKYEKLLKINQDNLDYLNRKNEDVSYNKFVLRKDRR